MQPFVLNSGDYLDARGFDELLDHLAQAESSRGAHPAAVSVVNSLPRLIINEEHLKQDGLACSICKDSLLIGTVVNQLPCRHIYHPYCILPWFSERNSCPFCWYELPTDDKDYEDWKRNTDTGLEIHAIQQHDVNEDSSSDISDDAEAELSHYGHRAIEQGELVSVDNVADRVEREGATGRWFFLAAAPIVSLVGIVLVLWLRNPQRQGRGSTGRCEIPIQQQHPKQCGVYFPRNQRETSGSRRWWSFF